MTTKTSRPLRFSPVFPLLKARGGIWNLTDESEILLRFQPANEEFRRSQSLGLCDLSPSKKWGVKGSEAYEWLAQRDILPPDGILTFHILPKGGLIARAGDDEFLLETLPWDSQLDQLNSEIACLETSQVLSIDHDEATIALTGTLRLKVLAQTCGLDPRQLNPGTLSWTRIAGVSSCLLPMEFACGPGIRIWVDASDACSLWESLSEIVEDLGGAIVGTECLFQEFA